MKFKLRIANAMELASLYNAVSLVGKISGMKHRHRAHSEKLKLLHTFESMTEDDKAEFICAAVTMRNALANLWAAQVEIEVDGNSRETTAHSAHL